MEKVFLAQCVSFIGLVTPVVALLASVATGNIYDSGFPLGFFLLGVIATGVGTVCIMAGDKLV
jgi:hypothetical protein